MADSRPPRARTETQAVIDGCPCPHKHEFPDQPAAETYLGEFYPDDTTNLAAYKCVCGWWHVGHSRNTEWTRQKHVNRASESDLRACDWCGKPFVVWRPEQRFCRKAHADKDRVKRRKAERRASGG